MTDKIKIERRFIGILENGKAKDITFLDVTSLTTITDFMIIATGTSTRHVKSLVRQLIDSKQDFEILIGVEGLESGEWVLVDFGDIVIHIMLKSVREFYNLESLWNAQFTDRSESSL